MGWVGLFLVLLITGVGRLIWKGAEQVCSFAFWRGLIGKGPEEVVECCTTSSLDIGGCSPRLKCGGK